MLVYLGIGASLGNWIQIPQSMGADIQKVIEKVKLHISHQMKTYSNVKTIRGLIYTCFNVFWGLG